MRQFPRLFSPVKIGTLELKNRFVVPPMATNLAHDDGTVSPELIDYWVARAKGGFGLLMVEFTAIGRSMVTSETLPVLVCGTTGSCRVSRHSQMRCTSTVRG